MGTFCEVGVSDGLECNSLYLLHKGCRCVLLESNEAMKTRIELQFAPLLNGNRLGLGVGMIGPDNVNSTIEMTCAALKIDASELDFLSIDIDGMDIYQLAALEYRP